MSQRPSIALILGTRPEAIKLLPVKQAIDRLGAHATLLISSGQQRELSRQAFATFGLTPDVDLDLMQANQSLPDLTARLVQRLSAVLAERAPAAVLVHGDTTTALAGALAAFYQKIPLGHVEAGLRTYDFQNPWPEEMNRRLIDPLCRWCFAPTAASQDNLLAERIPADCIHVTGNTVIDALLQTHAKLREVGREAADVGRSHRLPAGFVDRFLARGATSPLVLVTGHRRESFGEGFARICEGIRRTADQHPDVGVIYPVHLNPNVREPVHRLLGQHPRIHLIEPVNYEDFILLMARAHFILTDSGGVQEEAPSLGKPVLVMRQTTERPEGVAAGTCRLVGTDPEKIATEAGRLLGDAAEYARRSVLRNPYGDGTASDRIARILASL